MVNTVSADHLPFLNIFKDYIVPFIVPLVSAFFGAFFAMRFTIKREKNKIEDDQVDSGNRAISALGLYINTVLVIKKQILDEYRENALRHLYVKPVQKINTQDIGIDYNSLSFLLGKKCRGILFKILIKEDYYKTLISLINNRSELFFNVYQKKLEDAGLTESNEITYDDIQRAVGPRAMVALKSMTDDIYQMSDEIVKDLVMLIKELKEDLERLFPKQKFIGIEIDESYKDSKESV